jgi:hypothetical protein
VVCRTVAQVEVSGGTAPAAERERSASLEVPVHDTTLGLHLFRIMSFRHVIDMFEAKSLHMSMPWSWDDPYEKLVDYSRQERVFAQCWSKRETSDAMWRIYSPDRMGLCVRTTRARLTQVLQSARATTPIRLPY